MTTNSDIENPTIKTYVDLFKNFKVGESCFVAGQTTRDLEFLRMPFKRAGLGVRIVAVQNDEIYQQPGVRIYREEGEFDEL